MTKPISSQVTGAYLTIGAMQSTCWDSALYVASSKYNMSEADLVETLVDTSDAVAKTFASISSIEVFAGDYTKDVAIPVGDRLVRFVAQQKALPGDSDVTTIARQVILAKELSTLPNLCPHCGANKHKASDDAPKLNAETLFIEHTRQCLECRKDFVLQYAPVATSATVTPTVG